MSGNYCVIEIKTANASNLGIEKDLKNLALFKSKVQYKRAIYLIYDDNLNSKVEGILEISKRVRFLPKIELWLQEEPEKAAYHFFTFVHPVENYDYPSPAPA